MNEQAELFDFTEQFTKDESEIDKEYPSQVLLYYSEDEKKELDIMTKKLIKHYWGADYLKGDRCNLILKIFRNECKKIDSGQNND